MIPTQGTSQCADSVLDSFLASEIAIPATARSSAATSQKRLRQILSNKSALDPAFPLLLSQNDCDFIGGSFARHTKIWPLDDIDVYIPIDGSQLVYRRGGLRLPYWIVTDDSSEPQRLLSAKWMRGEFLASDLLLEGFLDAVKQSYPRSSIRGDRHAVCLDTAIAATSESSGIGFDIVPCFSLVPDDGSERFYLIPDGDGGWIHTNPRRDTEICAELHRYHKETFRKVVRLIKYWNKGILGSGFSSYYIELAVCHYFAERRDAQKAIGSIVEAVACGFYALKRAFDQGSIKSFVDGAPLVTRPLLRTDQIAFLAKSLQWAYHAWDYAMTGDADSAVAWLKPLFGSKFGV